MATSFYQKSVREESRDGFQQSTAKSTWGRLERSANQLEESCFKENKHPRSRIVFIGRLVRFNGASSGPLS